MNDFQIKRINNSSLADQEFERLSCEIPDVTGLAEILNWFVQSSPDTAIPRVVPLDEFTNDVVFQYSSKWLVFGVT